MSALYLYSGCEQNPQQVGLAYTNYRRNKLSTTFAYSQEYMQSAASYQIDPELELRAGNWPVVGELPGCILDSTPDRWGRNLINKQFPGQKLNNLDYLLAVSDISRQGARRYKTNPDKQFLHPDTKVPKLIALPELLNAANSIDNPKHSREAIKYLLEAGSGSLGGARPKAVVEKYGRLYLAKFPHKNDEINVIANEYHALVGARKHGIEVPSCELVKVSESDVLLIERFDRIYNGA
jgi:serine/threonine-protein kinase HipA